MRWKQIRVSPAAHLNADWNVKKNVHTCLGNSLLLPPSLGRGSPSSVGAFECLAERHPQALIGRAVCLN